MPSLEKISGAWGASVGEFWDIFPIYIPIYVCITFFIFTSSTLLRKINGRWAFSEPFFLLIKTVGVYRYIIYMLVYLIFTINIFPFNILNVVHSYNFRYHGPEAILITNILMGQCLEIFNFRLFMTHLFPRPPDYSISAISKHSKSRGYSQLKVHCKKYCKIGHWTPRDLIHK